MDRRFQRLSALEAKFDSFSHEQKDGGKKRKKLLVGTSKKTTQKPSFKPSKRGVRARVAKRLRVRRNPSLLTMTSILRCLRVPTLSSFQRQLLLTSVASATAQSTLPHNFTCARAHAGRVSPCCSKRNHWRYCQRRARRGGLSSDLY
jgi:hypothetical protein